MIKKLVLLIGLLIVFKAFPQSSAPDSAWIFSYATTERQNKNGLHFAWSIDNKNWHAIGPEHAFFEIMLDSQV